MKLKIKTAYNICGGENGYFIHSKISNLLSWHKYSRSDI